MSDRLRFRKSWINPVVFLSFGGVVVLATWPLVAKINTHLSGGTTDTLVHYWNGWWVGQALATGGWPYHSSFLFYPAGISLVYHNFAWFNIGFWLVLGGEFAAYNLSVLFSLILCGFAVFLLIHDLTGDKRAAFLGGLIYLCWPFRLSQLDHPNLISTQWIPLFLLFLIRTVRRGRWQDGVLTGVFLTLIGYTRWQQLIGAAVLGGIYLAFALLNQLSTDAASSLRKRRWLFPLLLGGGIVVVALTPPILLLAGQQSAAPANLLVAEEETTMQTDLLAFLTPSSAHPVVGSLTQAAYDRYYPERTGGRLFPAYIGVTALALAVLGAWRARRSGLPWVVMALILAVLSLGPVLRINGRLYPDMPMPYRIAARLFIVRLLRFPDRFNLFLALPVAVLAAYGIAGVLTRARRSGRWATFVLPLLLGCGILFEYLVIPVPLQHTQISPFYAQMADETGDFAVLNLPLDSQKSKRYMFAQVFHHRPILQGKTARFPPGTYAYLDSHPWLQVLRQHDEMAPEFTDVSRQLTSLAKDNIRYIILHKTQTGADRLFHWQRYLLIDPRFEDEQIAVYPTTPLAGRDFVLANELATGIGPIRIFTSTHCLNPGRVWAVEVGWGTTANPEQNYDVQLALVANDGTARQTEVFPLSLDVPTGRWPANTVAWGYYTLKIPSSLPYGKYAAVMALVDSRTGAVRGQPVVLEQVTVSRSPCEFPTPSDAVTTNAVFGDALRLQGYQLDLDGDQLWVTLYWRSERRMEIDYKIFIHVFDPRTFVPVAQDDAMPHRWGLPTTFWSPGEMVTDRIPISLEQAPAGIYGVAVGVYDPMTAERLPVVDGGGQPQPDGRLVLPGEAIQVKPNVIGND